MIFIIVAVHVDVDGVLVDVQGDILVVQVNEHHDSLHGRVESEDFRFLSQVMTEKIYYPVVLGLGPSLMFVGLEIAIIFWLCQ